MHTYSSISNNYTLFSLEIEINYFKFFFLIFKTCKKVVIKFQIILKYIILFEGVRNIIITVSVGFVRQVEVELVRVDRHDQIH